MINILFIYLCFWVFISSFFIRWVVSLTKPKKLTQSERYKLDNVSHELQLTKIQLSNSLSENKKLTKEIKSRDNPRMYI